MSESLFQKNSKVYLDKIGYPNTRDLGVGLCAHLHKPVLVILIPNEGVATAIGYDSLAAFTQNLLGDVLSFMKDEGGEFFRLTQQEGIEVYHLGDRVYPVFDIRDTLFLKKAEDGTLHKYQNIPCNTVEIEDGNPASNAETVPKRE